MSKIQSLLDQISVLQAEVTEELKNEHKSKKKDNSKMNSEVIDTNPYSRLMALKSMGVVKNYENIRDFTVAIIGVGGVGSVAADMLTRCGIGRLLLFDYDTVEWANMNRQFYQTYHIGQSKSKVAAEVLKNVNPEVDIRYYEYNVTTQVYFEEFVKSLTTESLTNGPVDLVLSCVDNFEGRYTINTACNENNLIWFESGVAENAVSGHVQFISPGETACFACAPPLLVAQNIDEKTLKRDGVCAASLPTTISIIAGFLVQNTLKYLLNFGHVTHYLGYDALNDFFPKMKLRPNPTCSDPWCLKRQLEFAEKPRPEPAQEAVEDEPPVHESNEWGINIIDESNNEIDENLQLIQGISMAYTVPGFPDNRELERAEEATTTLAPSLEELMAELNKI